VATLETVDAVDANIEFTRSVEESEEESALVGGSLC
jgi:hypothetical protein